MPRRKTKKNTAVLILDMVSEFHFPDAQRLVRSARKTADGIARLKTRAYAANVPVIYVNDTAGKWESDQRAFIERCMKPEARGHDVVATIAPTTRDYFMFKPKHSAFFGTPLYTLLTQLHVTQLVLTGMTSHQCVLFTGMDAHVREFDLVVPTDCIGAGAATDTRHALYIFAQALKARITTSRSLRF
jgi:nicotinamidase-related amidase